MVRRLQNARFEGKMAGPSRFNSPAFLATAAQASEGFFVPAISLDENGEARLRSFQATFRQRYEIEADVTAAEAYDAAKLLVRLIEINDPQSLARAFPPTFSFPGASGNLSFDAEGNRTLGLKLHVARKGRFGPADSN
jgi:branched-chain amino acid transport system substrate-binding protein